MEDEMATGAEPVTRPDSARVALEDRLAEVTELPPADQVTVFEQLHAALAERLNEQPG